ncbi:hypothetical protein DAEQUDRAFT_679850 [Daedalea quercina L-15889]|uniref:C2H2-type domain-containing protein n=1 Tax=Daedalea quercina L-15889 TaxID=1314783 RepID=A0A165KY03_9APHY|nr:hypothetical protein DAEQUDRAFT_679850 [Daedalea quercina L-15889]
MDTSLHKSPYSDGSLILCADCHRQFASYDLLVTHISLDHSHLYSALQGLSSQPGSDTKYLHPHAGFQFRGERLPNVFEAFESDKHAEERAFNPCYPFLNADELELARWLNERLTSTEIDEFLKLKWVRRHPPSFRSCLTLRSWIEELPSGPQWRTARIELKGYDMAPRQSPPLLIYRNGLECLQFLHANPIWAPYCSPEAWLVQTGEGQRVITEFNTSLLAWKLQSVLPIGAAVVPVQFGADKLTVTGNVGDLEMHPILMTLAAIPDTIRSKLSNQAWICVGYLPTPKFNVHADYNGILTNRILHEAMDIITESLKVAAKDGAIMADGYGRARLQGLNGVHKPWWRDYPFTDPSTFCVPDLLHSVYKFFWDHFLKACQIAVGAEELDRRFAARHKRIGYAALRRVSEVKQMTGRMYREIMRSVIVMIGGAVEPRFLRAMRAIIDFFLAAQSPRHTPYSLARMTTHLRVFHENKDAIMNAGGRGTLNHWQIPKLELLSNFVPAILSRGTLPQWSCDAVEHLLRTEAKKPFLKFTNRHRNDFGEQCARHLDRVEKMQLFELYALFKTHGVGLQHALPSATAVDDVEINEASSTGLARTWVLHALPDTVTGAEYCIRARRTSRNLFATGSLTMIDSKVAYHLTKRPAAMYTIDQVATTYNLADFHAALADYAQGFDLDRRGGAIRWSSPSQDVGFDFVNTWETYRIQMLSTHDDAVRLDPETLRAIPPNAKFPFGMCDAVLIDSLKPDGEVRQRSLIVQVRSVFEPVPRPDCVLPSHLCTPLIYVQDFAFADLDEKGHPCKTPDILMYRLQRRCYPDVRGISQRAGEVIPLYNVVRPVDISPVFGGRIMDTRLNELTSLELPYEFWLNDMWDTELHETLAVDYE